MKNKQIPPIFDAHKSYGRYLKFDNHSVVIMNDGSVCLDGKPADDNKQFKYSDIKMKNAQGEKPRFVGIGTLFIRNAYVIDASKNPTDGCVFVRFYTKEAYDRKRGRHFCAYRIFDNKIECLNPDRVKCI